MAKPFVTLRVSCLALLFARCMERTAIAQACQSRPCGECRFPTDIPYQTNGSDCGVFALQYAEHVSRNAAFDFDQQDMPYFRLKIAADIMGLNIL